MIRKENIFLFFYCLIVLFIVFDGLRHNIIYNQYVTNLKELSVICLVVLILIDNDWKVDLSKFYSLLPFLFTVIIGFPAVVFYSNIPDEFIHFQANAFTSYIVYYRSLQVFLLFFVFYYYKEKTNRDFQYLLRLLVYFSVLYVVLTVLFYVYEFPFIIDYRPYWGRISSGYPTMDAQVLIAALVCNFMLVRWDSEKKRIIFNVILIAGILVQATGTGIATLGTFLILYFLYKIFTFKNYNSVCLRESLSSNFNSLIIGGILIATLFSYIILNYYEEVETVVYLFSSKVDSIFGNVEEAETVELRMNQFATVFSIYNSPLNWLFGGGTLLGLQIEGQYGFLLRAFGIPSLIAYFFFIAYNVFKAVKNIFRHEIFFFLLMVMMILTTTSATLLYSYLFAVQAIIALLFNYFIFYENNVLDREHTKLIIK